jgi:protein-S-isoprenylcysteine O-methyltransferase Ste14
MVKTKVVNSRVGKTLYGALFVIVLPILLVVWSITLDRTIQWPIPQWPMIGLGIGLIGTGIMLKGMLDLYQYGRGLPMNAYPPEKYVTRGTYAWFSHPIYLGAVLLSAGVSLWYQSSSGLYLITPIFALMIVALVIGYERLAVRKRFGKMVKEHQPLFSWPTYPDTKITLTKQTAMFLVIFLPWFVIGYFIDYIRCATTCSGFFLQLSQQQPIQNVLVLLWLIPNIFLVIRLFRARRPSQFLSAVITAALAACLGLYTYLVLPIFIPGIFESIWGMILQFFIVLAALNYAVIWQQLQRCCEWVANSRQDWLFFNGSFRIINHSIYAGLAGAVGVAIVSYIIGHNVASLLLLLLTVIGAATFAQAWWGSQALLRPFGYWGAILGGIIGIILVYGLSEVSLGQVALAGVLCAPFVQAIGRLRCLAQGCCHGVVTDKRFGIRVWQPQSRICLISGLKGQWILITQLYSIIFNLWLGPLLWALWLSESLPVSFIIGLYLILTGIERFAEDGYRGETQTKVLRGLLESQWVAIAGLLLGIGITMIPSSVAAFTHASIDFDLIFTAIIGGLFSAFALGMDFPKSTARFSRLSG